MSDSPTTAVFKFAAVRPAQSVTGDSPSCGVLRDARADDEHHKRHLRELLSKLGSTEEARRQWAKVDLAPLRPLAHLYSSLLEQYVTITGTRTESPPASASDALAYARWDGPLGEVDRSLTDAAWDALYTGYRTGPAAGALLDVPTAALRFLYFVTGAAEHALDAPEAALQALRATPLVPAVMNGVQGQQTPGPTNTAAPSGLGQSASDTAKAADLVAQVDLATQLVQQARNIIGSSTRTAAAVINLQTNPPPPQVQAGGAASAPVRAAVHIDTTVTAAPLREATTVAGRTALDLLGITVTTPLSEAMRLLAGHLRSTTAAAMTLSGTTALETEVKKAGLSTDLALLLLPSAAVLAAPAGQASPGPSTAPDVNVSGRIRPLGIGDLKVVKQTLLAYVPGEIAHIETVLKGESKSRIYRTLDRTQTTVFTSEEETREITRDTQSTDRFEVKKEAEQSLKEDMSLQAGVTATGTYGPVVVTAHGDFAYSTSSANSQKQSSNFARQVVDKAVSRVETRSKSERTVTILHEAEETNTHGVKNDEPGAVHINGIYRWVDKRYRAQVHNYGKRLMLEFVVPEPAAFQRALARASSKASVDAVAPVPFITVAGTPISPTDVTEGTYQALGSRYATAGLTPPPPENLVIGTTLEGNGIAAGASISKTSKELTPAEGYRFFANAYSVSLSVECAKYPRCSILVGDDVYVVRADNGAFTGVDTSIGAHGSLSSYSGPVPVGIVGYDVTGFVVNIQGVCWRTPEKYVAWQLSTYDKIHTAYETLQAAYDQKVNQERAARESAATFNGGNPVANREIEKRELHRLCLTMLTGSHFSQFHAVTNPADAPAHHPEVDVLEALEEGKISQFLEQAFEWEHLTYLFYPYFYGRKSSWVDVLATSDTDPLFQQFLTAGAARVLVPVSPAYNEAVLYFLTAPGTNIGSKVWKGGEPPLLDDPLYVSIADELRGQTDDLAGAVAEGDPWEFVLPTTLVWLQPDETLPVFP